jgi:predicted nucleotidyltransferase
LFVSVARCDARPDSDIDLAAEFHPAAKMELFGIIELEFELWRTAGTPG